MKTMTKFLISFFVGLSLVLAGVLMGGLDTIKSFDPSSFVLSNTDNKEYTYSFEDVYGGIQLDITNAQVNFYKHGDNDVKVKISQTNDDTSVSMSNDYVVIDQEYDLFNNQTIIEIGIPNGHRFDEIHIDSSIYCEINNIKMDHIDIKHEFGKLILNNIETDELLLESQLSQVELNQVKCEDNLSIDVIGSQILLTTLQEYNYDLNTVLSNIELYNQIYNGNVNEFVDHNARHQFNIKTILSEVIMKGEK